MERNRQLGSVWLSMPSGQAVTLLLEIDRPHLGYTVAKRCLDVIVCASLLLLLAPLLLLIGLAVKLDSPGPMFFRQDRAGLGGRPFRMTKFRSMCANAEDRLEEMRVRAAIGEFRVVDAPAFKATDDPRVTRLGRFLRRTSLDELPQLFDVLIGTMSLVGPRPLVPLEAAQLPSVANVRQLVKPGITGAWQTARRSTVTYEQRLAMDLDYVKRRSLLLDLLLLLKTPLAVLRGDGAW